MQKKYILAIDQGTTGSRVYIYDFLGNVVANEYEEIKQYYPKPAWVEHDPEEIWQGVLRLIKKALKHNSLKANDIHSIGITNQRETALIWERKTSKPIYNAIVWQCRRTTELCESLKKKNYSELVHKKTGLVIDAYFSGTKWQWILNQVENSRHRGENGELLAGTIDTWLLYKLTGEHYTDYTNASRTLLYNIQTKNWDQELLDCMEIPQLMLPQVLPSHSNFGTIKNIEELNGVPVHAMIGDQQAALFGQLCGNKGDAKNTYGTGSFFLLNTGSDLHLSGGGVLTTLACDLKGNVCYALEGSVFIAGAVVQWLRDQLKFFTKASEAEVLLKNLDNEVDGIVFVPAFAGLGVPYWDMQARGGIFGLSRDTNIAQITRAAIKAIAFQTYDLVNAIVNETKNTKDKNFSLNELKVDGGACANNYLMQFQADILQKKILRPQNLDTTALGAAFLAGLGSGFWSIENLKSMQKTQTIFEPKMDAGRRKEELDYWEQGIHRSGKWIRN